MVVTRQDLTPGQQLAQTNHASIEFILKHREIAESWHSISNYITVLAVKDQDELKMLIKKCLDAQLELTIFREPDLNNDITSICIEPSDTTQRLTSHIPLALKEKPKDDIVFHFNKKHNEDQSIPPWTIKHKGQTHYVNHIDVQDGVSWSTKENPDSSHTKGAIRFKGNLELINENDLLIAKIK